MSRYKFKIWEIVWVEPFDLNAVIIGVTDQNNLVVRWYNDEGEQFTAIVKQSEIIGEIK